MASLSILWLLSAALCQVTACFFPIFSRHIAGARSGEETSARAPGRRNVLSTSEHRIVIMTWRARRVSHGPRDRVRFDQQCNMPEKKRSERAREGGRIGETLNITYNATRGESGIRMALADIEDIRRHGRPQARVHYTNEPQASYSKYQAKYITGYGGFYTLQRLDRRRAAYRPTEHYLPTASTATDRASEGSFCSAQTAHVSGSGLT